MLERYPLLRAYQFMQELLDLKGDRFEFEMRMLLEAAESYTIDEVEIETVYDSKENHQTHFNPVKDSIRIYKILGAKFFKFIFSSLSSSVIDIVLFTAFCFLFKNLDKKFYVIYATICARVISAVYNYTINYKVVFKSKESVGKSTIKYVGLAIVQMVASALLVWCMTEVLKAVPETLCKIVVDTILFFVSYKIQQKFVFKQMH